MPKRSLPAIICLCLGLFLPNVSAAGTVLEDIVPIGPVILVGPYLMSPQPGGITVMWETANPCIGIVEYSEATPLIKGELPALDQKVTAPMVVALHELVLTGLKPETIYFYRIRCRSEVGAETVSEISSFQTAVRADSAFAFAVIGDSQGFPPRFKKIMELVWAERPNFVLSVGDVVDDGRVRQKWFDEFLKPAAPLMRFIPIYVAIGNHEQNDPAFYRYVSYPPPENYYSFDYGNAHFTVLDDSNESLAPESPMIVWLKKDLARTRARWKFVAHHQPLYSSDANDYGDTSLGRSNLGELKLRPLAQIYEKYHVDMVWYGHIHSYERTWPICRDRVDPERGVIYVQTGGSGGSLEEFAPQRSWFTAKLLRNWHYCLVTIHGNSLRLTASDIEGRLFDYLELRK